METEQFAQIENTKDERRSGVFIVNFEHISNNVPVFQLLTVADRLPSRHLPAQSYFISKLYHFRKIRL